MECYFQHLVLEMDDLGIDHDHSDFDFEIDAIDAIVEIDAIDAIDASDRVAFCAICCVYLIYHFFKH